MLSIFFFYTPQREIKLCLLKGEAKCEEMVLFSLRLESQSYGSCGWDHLREELSPHQSSLRGLIAIAGTSSALICLTWTFQRYFNREIQTWLLYCMVPVVQRRLCMERHHLCEMN